MKCISRKSCTNLKPGMGEPWAGHSMARLVDTVSVNREKSDF